LASSTPVGLLLTGGIKGNFLVFDVATVETLAKKKTGGLT
jgi:hypothetical protein